MTRAARLLDLLQALRRHRRPVTAARLAELLGVSPRTIYRDIATLMAQGANIEGEAGLGYLLRPGFLLPPLMLGEEEMEALVLGLRFVARHGDAGLLRAAADVAAKITAVLPAGMAEQAESIALLAGSRLPGPDPAIDVALLRQAIRDQRKLRLRYQDQHGVETERVVWPVALGFFETTRVLAAWCESRADFRHFRADRMRQADLLAERIPQRRVILLRDWRVQAGVPDPALAADRN